MIESIPISKLKGLKVVFENDLFELARFIVKVQLATDTPTRKARTTVGGLLASYENITSINCGATRKALHLHGFPQNASIVPDEEHVKLQEMIENSRQSAEESAIRRQTLKSAPSGRDPEM